MITLIGMPGSGKSTVGRVLSEQLHLERVDTDRLIESQEKQTLQQIMERLVHLLKILVAWKILEL